MSRPHVLVVCLSVLTLKVHLHGYPNGRGVDDACSDLIPQHGVRPQTSLPPYRISFTPASYRPGQNISVTLSACSTSGFLGFMLQARRADASQDQEELVGSFVPEPGSHQVCSDRSLVHSSADIKTVKAFTWLPPLTASGHITFRVTFVESGIVFWTNLHSDVLLDESLQESKNPRDTVNKTQSCHQETILNSSHSAWINTSTLMSSNYSSTSTTLDTSILTSKNNSLYLASSLTTLPTSLLTFLSNLKSSTHAVHNDARSDHCRQDSTQALTYCVLLIRSFIFFTRNIPALLQQECTVL